jgi:glycosyltransferase involved in cell wall biosynthesis
LNHSCLYLLKAPRGEDIDIEISLMAQNLQFCVHAYPSPIRHESRMFKETGSLAAANLFSNIFLLGTLAPDVRPVQELGPNRKIIRFGLLTERMGRSRVARILTIAEWWIRLFAWLRTKPVAVFSAHNLAALPIGIALKLYKGTRVVYATHELETQRTGWSPMVVRIAGHVERWLIYRTDAVFVVSPSIAEWYRNTYPGILVHVLRNVPLAADGRGVEGWAPFPLKTKLGIPEDELLFIYQGTYGAGRGVDVLIETFRHINDRHLVFLGFSDGSLEARRVDDAAKEVPNIHLHPAVSAKELSRYTAGADVGIYLIEESSQSYKLTVGNKVYEYMASGIPLIASDFPDVRSLLERYKSGWLVSPSGSDFAITVASITRNEVQRAKARLDNVWGEFCWENDVDGLISIYRSLAITYNGLHSGAECKQ